MSIARPQNRDEFRQYVLTKLGAPVLEINVISCRLNGILEANADPVPVFSHIDQIKVFDGKPALHDYAWIDLGEFPQHKLLQNYLYYCPR